MYDGCVVTHLSPVPKNMNAQEISTLRLRPVNQKRSPCQQHSSRRRQNRWFFGKWAVQIVLENFWTTFGVRSTFLLLWKPRTNFTFLNNFWAKYWLRAQINHEKANMYNFIENVNLCECLSTLWGLSIYIAVSRKVVLQTGKSLRDNVASYYG